MTVERLPTAAVAEVVARLVSSREGGIPQLADEIGGTLDRNARSCERRLRAILGSESANVDLDVVDWILQGASATHLWYEPPLLKFLPDPGTDPVVEHDETCAECRRWIDWSRGDAGVRVELRRPRRWPEWWSLCARCYAYSFLGEAIERHGATEKRKGPIPANGFKQKHSHALILDLYDLYLERGTGIGAFARTVWREHGFSSQIGCTSALSSRWARLGLPLRGKAEAKILNGRRRVRPVGTRISEADLRRMHVLHRRRRISIHSMCVQLHERYGYRTARSMATAVSYAWKKLGLEAYSRSEMTVEANTTRGLSPKDWRLRSQLRKAAGLTVHGLRPYRPTCAGTTRSGKSCSRKSLLDSTLCDLHDPRYADRAAAMADASRKRLAAHHRPREPVGPFQEEVRLLLEQGGFPSRSALASALGVTAGTLGSYLRMPPEQTVYSASVDAIRAAMPTVLAARAAEPEELAA